MRGNKKYNKKGFSVLRVCVCGGDNARRSCRRHSLSTTTLTEEAECIELCSCALFMGLKYVCVFVFGGFLFLFCFWGWGWGFSYVMWWDYYTHRIRMHRTLLLCFIHGFKVCMCFCFWGWGWGWGWDFFYVMWWGDVIWEFFLYWCVSRYLVICGGRKKISND